MLVLLAIILNLSLAAHAQAEEPYQPVVIKSRIEHVQPMTGIVLWTTSEHNRTHVIQLEYSYMKYRDVVKQKGVYDWSKMDKLLDDVARRGHQAIIRFYFVYPGQETTVPDYIKALADYRETHGKSEGRMTGFRDWSASRAQTFHSRVLRKAGRPV